MINASIVAASPLALGTGVSRGAQLKAEWLPLAANASIVSRAVIAHSDELTTGWRIRHADAGFGVGASIHGRLGIGRLSLATTAGMVAVYGRENRDQSGRVRGLFAVRTKRSTWATGPQVVGEAELRLDVHGAGSVVIGGGGRVYWLRIDDDKAARFGWFGAVGLGYAM